MQSKRDGLVPIGDALADQHASDLKGYIGWSENMAEQQGILNAHVEKLTKAYNELARLLDEG